MEEKQFNLKHSYCDLNAYFMLYNNEFYLASSKRLGYYNFMFDNNRNFDPEKLVLSHLHMIFSLTEIRLM